MYLKCLQFKSEHMLSFCKSAMMSDLSQLDTIMENADFLMIIITELHVF